MRYVSSAQIVSAEVGIELRLVVLDEVDLLAAVRAGRGPGTRSTSSWRTRRRPSGSRRGRRRPGPRPARSASAPRLGARPRASRSDATGRRRRSRSVWPRDSSCRTSSKITEWPPEPMPQGGTTQAIVIGPTPPAGMRLERDRLRRVGPPHELPGPVGGHVDILVRRRAAGSAGLRRA